jgi:hypothetical protein
MPTPVVYKSTDASAPVLSGTVGSFIGVLDACLVNGYGAKAAAGWTKEYTGTNLAAYRMGSGGSAVRMYLRVDDTGTTSARVRGFVSMTDVNTGVEPFPTDAQISGGGYAWKSTSADSTARPWVLIATPTAFYFLQWCNQTVFGTFDLAPGALSSSRDHGLFFGEYAYYGTGFEHNVAIIHSGVTQAQNARLGNRFGIAGLADGGCHFLARSPLNMAGSCPFHKAQLTYWQGTSDTSQDIVPIGLFAAPFAQPDPVSGNIRFSRLEVISPLPASGRVGYLPGFWGALTSSAINGGSASANMTEIAGSGELESHTLLLLVTGAGSRSGLSANHYNAQIAIDITNWP